MLDALQKIGMRFRRNRQRWATEILKATKGEELTRLKAYVDDGGVDSPLECLSWSGHRIVQSCHLHPAGWHCVLQAMQ